MGYPRLEVDKQCELAPTLLTAMEGKPQPQQDRYTHTYFLNIIFIFIIHCTDICLCPQLDAPADPYSVPHEVPCGRLQEGFSLHTDGETQDRPAAAGVHAGCPADALWVSSSTTLPLWLYSELFYSIKTHSDSWIHCTVQEYCSSQ